jgi:hypothetical protein
VLIGGDFGVAGVLALFLIYAAPLALAAVVRPTNQLNFRQCALALNARFSLLVLGSVSMYMILANGGLVPFTGKNVFLLGLDSIGDVLESGVLAAVSVLCLAKAR